MWVVDPLTNQHGMTAVDAYMRAANRIRVVDDSMQERAVGRLMEP
jgi:hypothetical protein